MSEGESRSDGNLVYRYLFRFQDGQTASATVELDYQTLALAAPPPPEEQPFWTRLGFHQCPNCPLDERRHPRCPIARNLVGVVELFQDRLSYEDVEVTVETAGRRYSKSTSLQQGVSSLMGIINVTSGCPIFDRLRPMVATHLPFMTPDESTYRMISTYLMAQYFLHRMGRPADLKLEGFVAFLVEARATNTAFCERLHALGMKDANLNALSNLNALGEIVSLSIETQDLERWERLFARHYGES